MTRVALDSNVLIYAELEPDSDKGRRAAEVILLAARDGVIAVQALGEFLRVVQRRAPGALPEAIVQAKLYGSIFLTPATTPEMLSRAAALARDHRLQLWDGLICAVSANAGAECLLTEDLQGGRTVNGLRLLNPFERANDAQIAAMLTG